MKTAKRLTHRQICSLGGQALVKKYGRAYMSALGRKGAATTWSRYFLSPLNTSEFGMYRRSDGKFIKTLSGKDVQKMMGKKE